MASMVERFLCARLAERLKMITDAQCVTELQVYLGADAFVEYQHLAE